MDQLRKFFRVLRRIHFWIICGLVTLLSLVFWFLAVSNLNKEKKSRVAEIEGQFSLATKYSSEADIPNSKIAEKMDTLIVQRQQEILEAWQVKYDQQNSEATGILTWAEELGRPFIRKMTPLRPIEKEVEVPMKVEMLNIGEREIYRDFIKRELPKLADSVGAQWLADGTASPMATRGYEFGSNAAGGETLSNQSIVEWDTVNQQELVGTHFTWGGVGGGISGGFEGGMRGGFEGGIRGGAGGTLEVPSTLEILYAQEDLWVLRSLMKIIAETNAGAKSRFNAAIKRIEFIKIGKAAVNCAGRVTIAKTKEEVDAASAGPTAEGYDQMEMMGGRPDRGEGGPTEMSMGTEEYGMGREGGMMNAAPDPADLRYVDKFYKPLPAEELRTVMKSTETLEPDKAYLAVAKRVPIRMRVSIDQRKLAHLLVECANAELTVEVRQVRVNPTDDGSTSMFGMGAGGFPGREGGGRRPMEAGSSWMGGSETGMQPEVNLFPFDVTVEIYGIVYIYNPVDKRAMGIEDATEGELDPNSVTERADPTTTGLAAS